MMMIPTPTDSSVKPPSKIENGNWIFCCERLPKVKERPWANYNSKTKSFEDVISEESDTVLVTVMEGNHYFVTTARLFNGEWFNENADELKEVIAWMPLPEPCQLYKMPCADCPYRNKNN